MFCRLITDATVRPPFFYWKQKGAAEYATSYPNLLRIKYTKLVCKCQMQYMEKRCAPSGNASLFCFDYLISTIFSSHISGAS